MPLIRLTRFLFEGVEFSDPEVIIAHPGWLFVQRCEAHVEGGLREDSCVALLVCRSPLVKDTSRLYQPVTELVLGADRMDLVAQGAYPDESMMHGSAEYQLFRLAHADHQCTHSADEIRAAIQEAMSDSSPEGEPAV